MRPTLKENGGGSIVLSGCVAKSRTWKLVKADGRMDGAKSRTTMEENRSEAAKDSPTSRTTAARATTHPSVQPNQCVRTA